jgi:hypothetical protein
MIEPHFVDPAMKKAIRARILELYYQHGLAAFQLPEVKKAIDLLLDADPATRLSPVKLAEIHRIWRQHRKLYYSVKLLLFTGAVLQ